MKIWKDFRFEAAHFLPAVPKDHPCHQLHGHSYLVRIVLTGEVGKNGFVMDYGELTKIVKPLIDQLDHQLLNNVLLNPTSEELAFWLWQQLHPVLPVMSSVVVQETGSTGAETSWGV